VMPRLPSRAALLVPVLSLGLLVPGFNPGLTKADTLPTPCELVAVANPAEDTVLLLRAILPADVDPALAVAAPFPILAAPPPRGIAIPPGGVGVPKPLGTDLRPPDARLLNQEPIVATRQLRESLTEKQKADLRAVLARYQGAPQQGRTRQPELSPDRRGIRPARAGQEATVNQASTDAPRLSHQLDQDIESLLTPSQRDLLRNARPTRLRSELPSANPDTVVAGGESAC
jgi:hypothetical protein